MTTRHFQRAVSAVATAVGRPSLLAHARLLSFWAAVPAAAAEVPQVAAQSSDNSAFVGSFGMPTAAVIAAATGLFFTIHRMGELTEKVAASEKTIATITAATETKIAANKEAAASAIASANTTIAANKEAAASAIAAYKEAAASAIASTEAKLVANEKAAASAIASTEAKLAANKEAANAAIVANKESAASAIASTEAKLAAAEKVIAAMVAGVSVTAELATLKALKGEIR